MVCIRNGLSVLLLITVLNSAIVNTTILRKAENKTKISSPRVIFIANGSSISDFMNYQNNQTFYWESDTITLRCEPTYVTQWMWQIPGDLEYYNRITLDLSKERTQHEYLSELKINLYDTEETSTANLSCSKAGNDVELSDPDAFVTCINIQVDPDNKKVLSIKEDVPRKICHGQIYGNPDRSCTSELILDLEQGAGMCNENNTRIRTKPCKDLDSCESILRFETGSTKTCGIIRDLTETDTFTLFRPGPLKIIYCLKHYVEWRASYLPYPTFNTSSWKQFRLVETKDDALKHSSILLYALESDEPFSASFIKPIDRLEFRTEFALGETVEFVCIGVQYLYMKGFQYQMGGNGWKVSLNDGREVYQLDSERHITRKNISLRSNNRTGNWVSCRGPIWNTDQWKETTLPFTLSSPQLPKAALEIKPSDVDGFKKLVCLYEGWPRPIIRWVASKELAEFGNESSHTRTTSTRGYSMRSWYQTRYVKNDDIFNVHCTATNFLGRHDSNTITDNITSIPSMEIAIGVMICLIVILLVIAVVVNYKLRHKLQSLLTKEELQQFERGGLECATKSQQEYDYCSFAYNKEKYEIGKIDFKFDSSTIIGSGYFGNVYKATIPSICKPVAIKVPKINGKLELLSVLREIKLMSFVGEHDNILKLVGAYTKEVQKGIVYIITEYLQNGSLLEHLRRKENVEDSSRLELYQFCLEIASAMHFLNEKKVVHGDLSARNVLLNEDNVCKICDFGLSRKLYDMKAYVISSGEPVPWKWMAVETLERSELSVKSDNWSMGITFWEIFTLGKEPYQSISWDLDFSSKLVNGMRLPKPTLADETVYEKMLSCWEINSDKRVDASDIIKFFRCKIHSFYTSL